MNDVLWIVNGVSYIVSYGENTIDINIPDNKKIVEYFSHTDDKGIDWYSLSFED